MMAANVLKVMKNGPQAVVFHGIRESGLKE